MVIFPEAENIHLIKDVGMLPYILHKELNYSSCLACYKNGDYPNLEKCLSGLKLQFIPKVFNITFIDTTLFILKNAKHFDTLQVFHYRFRSLFFLYLFKFLKRGKGKTYLKLDANERILQIAFNGKFQRFKDYLFKKIDIVSVETSKLQSALSLKWKRQVALLPNGVKRPIDSSLVNYQAKKNTIITVARIGAPEKRHDLLLQAFAQIAPQFPAWSLQLIGPIEASFNNYINEFFIQYPNLKHSVFFIGNINNRDELKIYYDQAKVFCLCSDYEGFPIALLEAAFSGCFLITTDIVSANDITHKGDYGVIIPIGNKEKLIETMGVVFNDEDRIRRNTSEIQRYMLDNFTWEYIATGLGKLLTTKSDRL